MKLRTWRVDSGMRLEDACPKFGMNLNRLSAVERGAVWPTPVEIAVILEVTGQAVTLGDLYESWHVANPEATNDFRRRAVMG